MNVRSILVMVGGVFCAVYGAWVHSGEPTSTSALIPLLGAALTAILGFLPQVQGGAPIPTGASVSVDGPKVGPKFVRVPNKNGFVAVRALAFASVIGLLSVIGMSQANCTASEFAAVKNDVNIVLTDAQKVCANQAFDAVIVAIGTISPAAEAAIQTACGIDATLSTAVHSVAQARLSAHAIVASDASSDAVSDAISRSDH